MDNAYAISRVPSQVEPMTYILRELKEKGALGKIAQLTGMLN